MSDHEQVPLPDQPRNDGEYLVPDGYLEIVGVARTGPCPRCGCPVVEALMRERHQPETEQRETLWQDANYSTPGEHTAERCAAWLARPNRAC